ncbi:MAG TPA: MFS transporter [Pyrinomonadaceae bacterium]|jgi:UMF1 family MFS transporter
MNVSSETKNDRREIFGWMMYDWANSAYYTTVIGVLIAPYLTRLAQASVGDNGVVFDLGFMGAITAKSLTSATTVIGVLIQAFLMILLSAIADYSNLKKTFMMILCYTGVAAGCLMFFIDGDSYLLGCALLIITNVCIGASLVFYNAYLTEITTEDRRDKVSAKGYAYGYIGGSIMLLVNLLLLNYADALGISTSFAIRICLLVAALWWGGFAVITFTRLKRRGVKREAPAGKNIFSIAFAEIAQTLREFLHLRLTLLFLVAYLFYNDGIQTVIYQASVFVEQELFIAKGLPSDPIFLVLLFLETQIVAFIGALFWERVSRRIGAKNTILVSLAWWAGIVIFAYGFLHDKSQAWYLGAAIGFVLGGTQSLSRSLYSQMIPKGREASFFSFYEISEKGTSWMGLLIFSVVVASTGSYRHAILALIFFFVVGGLLLAFNPIKKAIHEAGQHTPEEATAGN